MRFRKPSPEPDLDPAYNTRRTDDLYSTTPDGYIIAHDVACQNDFVAMHRCPASGEPLRVVAHINRAFQGLNEVVALSPVTGERFSFIFDISNEVYQQWWAQQMGDLYERQYDGPPRRVDRQRR